MMKFQIPKLAPSLVDVAKRVHKERGAFSKPYSFYEAYETYFREYRSKPIKVLEIGVFEGESTKVFAGYFRKASIIGVDLETRDIDFSAFPNVTYLKGNQTSADDLRAILDRHAPDGVDIIIDDASHIGHFSRITFAHVFSRLKPGGLYVVEDWGTGYYKQWPDGETYTRWQTGPDDMHIPNRISSHDIGMVGFLKSLVDVVGGADIEVGAPIPHQSRPPAEFLHIYPGTAILKKARAGNHPVAAIEF